MNLMKNIILAEHSGFCFGVKRAVNLVYDEFIQLGDFELGEIVKENLDGPKEKFTLKGTTDVEGLPAKINETSEASINVKDLVIRDLHYNFNVTGNVDDGFMTDEETFKIDYTYENKKGDIPSYDPSDFDEVE